MNISYNDIRVMIHSHKLDAPINITDSVTSLSYTRLVRSPFESATVELANYGNSPFFSIGGEDGSLFSPTPKGFPSVDFWLVIMKSTEVLFWGYVSSIRTSLRAREDGLVDSSGLTLSASSWVSLLSKCAIALTPESEGTARSVEGAFYGFDDWGNRFTSLAKGISVPYLGETMKEVLSQLLGPKLPKTLARGDSPNLLSSVKLIYNKETQDSVNPQREQPIFPVIGSNITGFLAGSTLARQSIWSLLQAAFNPSSNIVEMFPSFESNQDSDIGLSIPCIPTLMYRMRPIDPGFNFNDADNDALSKVYGSLKAGESALSLPSKDIIKREGSGGYKEIEIDTILGINFSMSDDNRMNAVWVESPFLGKKRTLFSTFARAAINYPDVEEYGARIFDLKWPLFPAADATADTYKNLEAVIDYAYLVYGEGENYMSGSIALSPSLNFAPGEWYSIRGLDKNEKDKAFTFYVTGAAHRITVSSFTGNIEASTEVLYERGSFGRLPSVPRVEV